MLARGTTSRISPINIDSQSAFNQAARQIKWCYLCGLPITKADSDVDHLVPSALLGSSPSNADWRPTLRVHSKCHSQKNDGGDEFAALLHKVFTTKACAWPKQVRSLKIQTGREYIDRLNSSFGFLHGVGRVHAAAINWSRGLLSLLYGEYFPPPTERLACGVMTPFAEARSGATLEQTEEAKSFFRFLLYCAFKEGRLDRITAFGDRLQFACVWIKDEIYPNVNTCAWVLTYPGVEKYKVKEIGNWNPFLGYYSRVHRPESCQVISVHELNKYTS